jgi:hypothetical protein
VSTPFSGHPCPPPPPSSAFVPQQKEREDRLAITHIFPRRINALLAPRRRCPSVLSRLKALHFERPYRLKHTSKP